MLADEDEAPYGRDRLVQFVVLGKDNKPVTVSAELWQRWLQEARDDEMRRLKLKP